MTDQCHLSFLKHQPNWEEHVTVTTAAGTGDLNPASYGNCVVVICALSLLSVMPIGGSLICMSSRLYSS